ncbi:MAG: efflux RND transporter periplasmic adaptor subunit [Tagaea sp.]|nr:efflux RND transporter periplasmic adaptor subunit [Tagaea sp.]
MNRKLLFAVVLCALAAGAAFALGARETAQAPAPAARETRASVVAPGRVEPATEERDVTAELRGKLVEVLVDEGDKVSEGQIVARLVDDEYRARVAQGRAGVALREAELERVLNGARGQERREAQAQTREAQAQLDQAKLDLARREPLARQGHSSGEALDRARTEVSAAEARLRARQERAALIDARARSEDIDIARAQLAMAKGQLAEAEAFLEKTRVRSPIDGTVLHRFKRTGEGVSDQPPTPIVKVGDLSRLRVRVDVDETDVARVAVGMRAYVTADAWPGRRFEGTVVRVGQRLGRKTLRTDDPTERNDTKVLETLIELDAGVVLPVGLRVDAFLGAGPAS